MLIQDSVVLITGGTGTFGKAFTRHALIHGAKQVRIFSRDELKQYHMDQDFADPRIKFICGDVRDEARITEACKGVHIVVHAAAMKRLETCEKEPLEAIKTNVLGSINVTKACKVNDVRTAIALSSDKAVHPANTYGKTKSLMENIWIQSNDGLEESHSTRFSIVRYGNVMGSRGSVADIFRKQASEGQVKVTDPDMTRFFMPVEWAVELVGLAIAHQQAGEMFIPYLKATTIGALAEVVAKGAPVVVTGPRPGEKMHEDIITEKELTRSRLFKGAVVVNPESPTWFYIRDFYGIEKQFTFPARSCDAQQMTPEEISGLVELRGQMQGFGV